VDRSQVESCLAFVESSLSKLFSLPSTLPGAEQSVSLVLGLAPNSCNAGRVESIGLLPVWYTYAAVDSAIIYRLRRTLDTIKLRIEELRDAVQEHSRTTQATEESGSRGRRRFFKVGYQLTWLGQWYSSLGFVGML